MIRRNSNIGELEANLRKLHTKQRHADTIKAVETSSRVEVDLGNLANRIGGAAGKDFTSRTSAANCARPRRSSTA